MDLKQIQELIRFVSKAGVSEVALEQDDFKIVIKTGRDDQRGGQQMTYAPAQQVYHAPQQQQAPQHQGGEAPQAAAPAAKAEPAEEKGEVIKSPMIGTFYRKPSPDKEVFVKVG